MTTPQFIVIAGPNGAGKSTSALDLLPGEIAYVNADEIAKRLFSPGHNHDIEAGRLLLAEWDKLQAQKANFAIETTLASRSLVPRIKLLKENGYQFRLIFLWLPSVELAIARVQDRIKRGGHSVPELTIRRRYNNGLRNLFELYMPIADTWAILQNRENSEPLLIAEYQKEQTDIHEKELWNRITHDANAR